MKKWVCSVCGYVHEGDSAQYDLSNDRTIHKRHHTVHTTIIKIKIHSLIPL